MAVKVFILFAIPFLLRPQVVHEPLLPAAAGGILALGFFPVAVDLLLGQDAILLALIFVLAFTALLRGAEFRCGILLALGLFKFHLVLPIVLVFLLKRKGRICAGVLSAALVLLLISLFLVGWIGLVHYPKYLWSLNEMQHVGVVTPQAMPNFRGLAGALLGGRGAQSQFAPLFLAIAILGAIFTAHVWFSNGRDDPRLTSAGFSLCLVVAILTSYYAYSYDMTLLIIPLWVLGGTFLNRRAVPRWPRSLFLAGMGLLLFTPLLWFLVLRSSQFYWVALLILLLLCGSLASTIKQWQALLSAPHLGSRR